MREAWTRELNGTPIGTLQLVAGCYFGVNNSGVILGPYNAHNVSSVTRASAGEYTVTLTSTTGFTLGSGMAFASTYGRTNDTPSESMGDNEFASNIGVKVKSANVEINTKDNDTNTDKDIKYAYFVLFSD